MLTALEHQEAFQNQQHAILEQEIVWQREEWATLEELLKTVRRDHDNVGNDVQTLSERLTQDLKQIGDLTIELGQTRQTI